MSDNTNEAEGQEPEVVEQPTNKRGKKKAVEAESQEPETTSAPKFVLLKNHGFPRDGYTWKTNQFFAAGTEFDPVKDKDLIAKLAQTGAKLDLQ